MECPRKLYEYVNKLVSVTTNSRTIEGIVVTIDPETNMILLINKEDHSKTHLINGDMVQSKQILDPVTSYSDVTDAYLTKLYDRPNQIDALVRKTLSTNARCSKIGELLRKHKHHVITENGVLKISDQLIIVPPYGSEQCISSDKSLLDSVKNIINSFPV